MLESRPATLTYDDYLKTPDDERWELLRGELLMVPGTQTDHAAPEDHPRKLGPILCSAFVEKRTPSGK